MKYACSFTNHRNKSIAATRKLNEGVALVRLAGCLFMRLRQAQVVAHLGVDPRVRHHNKRKRRSRITPVLRCGKAHGDREPLDGYLNI
jgi:hypothetical protein